jgi:succinate dehydrogenase/fumarate reductase flavoprotein subunit
MERYAPTAKDLASRDVVSRAMTKEILALYNYYRNYHIYNSEIEKETDYFNNNIVYRS